MNIGGASTSGGGSGTNPGTGTGTGAGSETEPYNVAYVLSGGTGTGVWVEGYIVGFVRNPGWTGATFSNDMTGVSEVFEDEGSYTNTNAILAGTANVTSAASAIPLQLSSAVRPELGLRTNPGIYLKHVKVKGDIGTYFKVPGIKTVSEYKILD